MNSMFFSVFKIFAKNIFSFSAFMDGFKKGIKGILKNILLILITIYCVAVFGAMYYLTMTSSYKVFEEAGKPDLLPVLATFTVLIVTFIFGMLSVASNYYTGCGEEQFLSMPLSSKDIFGAKFCVSCLTDASLGIILFAVAGSIYGYNQHLLGNPLFYVGLIIASISVTLFSILLIYVLMILILTLVPSLRKKTFLSGIASIFIIGFSVGYSFLYTKLSVVFEQKDYSSLNNFLPGLITSITKKMPYLNFLSKSLKGDILSILVMLAITAVIVFLLIPLLAPLYIKTLNGFSDIKTKKIDEKEIQEVFSTEIKHSSVAKTLYLRDIRTVFREPAFFSNGPLVIIIFPIIVLISFVFGLKSVDGNTFDEIVQSIRDAFFSMDSITYDKIKFFITLGIAVAITFLGNSTSIASTSFSREGKALYDLKAMPLEYELIVKTKFFHALTYVLFSGVFITIFSLGIMLYLSIPYSAKEFLSIYLVGFCLACAVSTLLIIIEMFIDTANPKLLWENPIAAFKQNVNAVVSAFITLFVVALLAGLGFILPKNLQGILILTVIFIVISAPLGSLYFKYAPKRMITM